MDYFVKQNRNKSGSDHHMLRSDALKKSAERTRPRSTGGSPCMSLYTSSYTSSYVVMVNTPGARNNNYDNMISGFRFNAARRGERCCVSARGCVKTERRATRDERSRTSRHNSFSSRAAATVITLNTARYRSYSNRSPAAADAAAPAHERP